MRSCVDVVALRKAGFRKKKRKKVSLVLDRLGALLSSASLLGEEDGMDVGEDTTLCDGHSGKKLVQLLIVADGQLEVARVDPLFLVVPGGIASQLKDLSSEVLHHGSQVDWGASADTLGVVPCLEETVDTTHGELESRTSGTALGLGTSLASFATSRHDR